MGKSVSINNIPAYEVKPPGECKGGLILIHEVWGLTDHIKDVADRFSAEGYYILAPDLLSDTDIEKQLTPELQRDLFNPKKRDSLQPQLRRLMAPLQTPDFAQLTEEKLIECFEYLEKKSSVRGKVGVIGYCFGGSYSFSLAIAEPRLRAAVPYYGHCDQNAQELSFITCPVLAFYGENDQRLMDGLTELTQTMRSAHVDFSYEVYPDTGHAFFNDTNATAYNAAAAEDAWHKTLDFLATSFAN